MLPVMGPTQQRPPGGAAPGTPFRYVRIPDRLLRAALHTPRAAGVYAVIARTWLATGEPVPLSATDLTLLDPSLSRGAGQRVLAWLIKHEWIVVARRDGTKNCFEPTWGAIQGKPRLWLRSDSRYGRPPHVRSVTLDVRLLDICIGRLIPFGGQRAARVTRYLSTPALSLDDVGAYAMRLGGYGGGESHRLTCLGLVRLDQALPLGEDGALFARLSQLALVEHTTLNASGVRRAGFNHHPAPETGNNALFFLPRELIGIPSAQVIDHVIDTTEQLQTVQTAPECAQTTIETTAHSIPWDSQESQETDLPTGRARRGGRHTPEKCKLEEPLPDTPTANLLKELGVSATNIRILAHLPVDITQRAIAYAQQETSIKKKVNWITWALKQYRKHKIERWQVTNAAVTDWNAIAERSDGYMRLGDDLDGIAGIGGGESSPVQSGIHDQVPEPLSEIEPLAIGDVTERLVETLREVTLVWQWPYLQQHIEGMTAQYDGRTIRVLTLTDVARRSVETTFRSLFDHALRLLSVDIPPVLIVARAPRPAAPPAPAAERPAWIDHALWERLPALLRVALAAAQLEGGIVKWSDPGLGQVMEQRYGELVGDVYTLAAGQRAGQSF